MNAIVTSTNNGGRALVYAHPPTSAAPVSVQKIRVHLPADAQDIRLTCLGAEENNIIASWKALGAPAYPTPEQLGLLRSANTLKDAPEKITIEYDYAIFTMENPGVALLEWML